jgi:hypothetical protein
MSLVGRRHEQEQLETCLWSGRPEFVAVYGRRRVGKTYLVREFFKNRFAFYATGTAQKKTRDQLRAFHEALRNAGDTTRAMPGDWFEAFSRLRALLEGDDVAREPGSGRRVVFLDELPWMDTPRSDFRAAFDFFWNSWASAQDDLLMIACGSATSWMIDNLIEDHGGFYNRVTRQIHLKPFSLLETQELLDMQNLGFTQAQVLEAYMVFGGIPFYLNLLDRKYSLAQNVDQLCFGRGGQLCNEFERLFASLFRRSERHVAIVRALAQTNRGMLRTELSARPEIGDGEPLTKALRGLEQCGFIRGYQSYVTRSKGRVFQLVDPFSRFYLRFLAKTDDHGPTSWVDFHRTPEYFAWRGLAFENVCLLHVRQIKAALGISGISTAEYAWHSRGTNPGAQIDLLIDRADGVVNVCEAKFMDGELAIDASMAEDLRRRLDVFQAEVKPRKALHLTIISVSGVARNAYYDTVQRVITADDLFT